MNSNRIIHCFENGVKVYDDHLLQLQRDRYAHINVHEAEEEGVFLQLINNVVNGACFVNIGAAIGYYCILAAKIKPELKIVALEPLSRHQCYLYENIRLNGFEETRFSIIPKAIYPVAGLVDFADMNYGSFVMKPAISDNNIPVEKVQALALSELCTEINGRIGLLQMDIQGDEFNVLKEYVSCFSGEGPVDQFLIGTHGVDLHTNCRSLFKNIGYKIVADIPAPSHQPDGVLAAVKT